MADLNQLRQGIREQQTILLQTLRKNGLFSPEYGKAARDSLIPIDTAAGYAVQRINRMGIAVPKVAMLAAGRPYTYSVQRAYEVLMKSIPNEKMADLIAAGLGITDDEIDREPVAGHISPGWSLHAMCFVSSPRWEEQAFPRLKEAIGKEIPKALVDSAYSQALAGQKGK